MNTKRIMRWVIVLFLLAALPVMTAVMAQEQEPAGKQLPVVTEPGESAAPDTYNLYESESNNTLGTADVMNRGDVMGGKIGAAGDVDYFRFQASSWYGIVLIDIDAQSIGSTLDSVVCLLDQSGTELACNDDTDTGDSLVFYRPQSGLHYIRVTQYGNSSGGDSYSYELILSSPLLISAPAAKLGTGMVAGIPFKSEDILAHSDLNTGFQKWVMFFDGSDVGITKNVTNVAADNDSSAILLSLANNLTLPGAGLVTPWDIVTFTPSRYGPATAGTFSMAFPGRQHDLTTSAEKLDALVEGGYDRFWVSTVGAAAVPYYGGSAGTLKPKDEDVFIWRGDGNDEWWQDFWAQYVTGLAAEDVNAAAFNSVDNLMYLNILGKGKIFGHTVTQKDIFAITYTPQSGNTNYTWGGLVWHGPDHGWNYNIDAIELSGW